MSKSYYVYILTNRPRGVLYVGYSTNLISRVTTHKQKTMPGFTRAYGLTQLVYCEAFPSIQEARARERAVKRWRRGWKFKLIESINPDWRDLSSELLD